MTAFYDWQGNLIGRDEWARLFEDERHVGDSHVGDVHVSTVWLGADHGFGHGRPLIFETMVFGGVHDQEQWRYATEREAREGHAAAVALVSAGVVS